jgi:Tetracyclin repressor-like, C-terminal domain
MLVADTYGAEPNTLLAGRATVEVLRTAGVPPERAGRATFAMTYYVLGYTIREQAQQQLAQHDDWQDRLLVRADGEDPQFMEEVVATVVTANPPERFAYRLKLFIDGTCHQVSAPAHSKALGRKPPPRQTSG